ncbi:MAG: PRC-barrel domain-containing protein, partial [Chloroflexota bacterium]|nr:PRC-barrel domain-containing protein [Chloroflexota bacterium]
MKLRFGADIRQRDGYVLGNLQHVVYDPATRQVVALVAGEGGGQDPHLDAYDTGVMQFGGHQVVVPMGAIASTDLDDIYVEFSQQQWDDLDSYLASERNIAPPPHIDASNEDHIAEPVNIPEVTPVGAASGIESIAFTPIIQETTNVSADDQILDASTAVWATDGEVGKVRALEVSDETRHIENVILGGRHLDGEVEVPAEWIASIQSGTVVLTVNQTTLQ